jgi:hypothetical protein
LDVDYDPGLWFLASSTDGSRLLLVHTYGVLDEDYLGGFILMAILMLIIALITTVALITPLPPGLAARCSPRILVS